MSLITAPPANAQSVPGKAPVIRVPCDSTLLPGAITNANTLGTATVRLAPRCTYITTAPLVISGANVTIVGGPSTAVRATTVAPFGPVFTVTGGLRAEGFFILGGNAAATGGGIDVTGGGRLELRHMTVSGNGATTTGGGINVAATASATIISSVIDANTATTTGGGINNAGTLRLFNTLVSGNHATTNGGGIHNSGTATIVRSTISGNTAIAAGGGIFNTATGTVRLIRSLVEHNKADNAVPTNGGGINNANPAPGSVTLTHSLVRRNSPNNCTTPLAAPIQGCVG
jgi:predicted outer membrane repeat protein